MNFLQPSGLQLGWGRGRGRWKSRVVPGRVTHLPYFNLHHSVMKCFIYSQGTEGEIWGGEEWCGGERLWMSQLLQALGFVSCSIFWAVNLPWAGWFIISCWCKGPRRHICLFFSSAVEMPLNDMSYFYQKTCIVQVSVRLGTATPENACISIASVSILPEKFGQIPQICLSCPHRLSHEGILVQLHGLDWPRVLRTRVRLCFQSWGLSWPRHLIILCTSVLAQSSWNNQGIVLQVHIISREWSFLNGWLLGNFPHSPSLVVGTLKWAKYALNFFIFNVAFMSSCLFFMYYSLTSTSGLPTEFWGLLFFLGCLLFGWFFFFQREDGLHIENHVSNHEALFVISFLI